MSIWRRLFSRSKSDYAASTRPDTLVEEPRPSATRLGAAPLVAPWSTSRLVNILRAYQGQPGTATADEARLARQCLSQFWLQAPVDQLEFLYASPIGECYRLLLACGLTAEPLYREELTWRSQLSDRLAQAFDRPETVNVLLGVMPYFPPGRMRVEDAQQQVPSWLIQDYARLFDTDLLSKLWEPVGLLAPAGQGYGKAPQLGMQRPVETPMDAPQPNRPQPPIPRLSKPRGAEALAQVQDEGFQRRMSGLINLFVIDPGETEVNEQLSDLRRLLGQIWLDAQPAQMEALYGDTAFGRLYQDLLASGFSRLPLNDQDRFLRNQLAPLVVDMNQPGALNALMAALPFYPPGRIAFVGGEHHLPDWLKQELATLYGSQAGEEGSESLPEGQQAPM